MTNSNVRQIRKTKVLFICHNHPEVRPGGAESYALELHRALRGSEEFEPVFLAKGGPPLSPAGRSHLGCYIGLAGREPDEYFMYTDNYEYDWTFGTMRHDKELYTKHFTRFLEAVRPDVVHLQQTMFFGYDILRAIRNALPDAPILYTLHEFMPICHRQGQMLRTVDESPCMEESPLRCHECFPEISPQTFFMRKKFVQSHFSVVDLFIAPSAFLRDRYVDWGIPADRIVVEEYGRVPPPGEVENEDREPRNRFGYFGQLTPYKGVDLVLEAMRELDVRTGGDDAVHRALAAAGFEIDGDAAARPRLRIHGANLDLQAGPFQNRMKELLELTSRNITFVGRYSRDQVAGLMSEIDWVIVPSRWWENSPLVIQEAFHFRRPVICSDIGGMAEKVADGVNGLHFRAGDPASLAETMQKAASAPGLWQRLREGIAPVYGMQEHVERLSELYRSLRVPGRKAVAGGA
jgi:glycosyltransferase involved in cell wall biosynthesis